MREHAGVVQSGLAGLWRGAGVLAQDLSRHGPGRVHAHLAHRSAQPRGRGVERQHRALLHPQAELRRHRSRRTVTRRFRVFPLPPRAHVVRRDAGGTRGWTDGREMRWAPASPSASSAVRGPRTVGRVAHSNAKRRVIEPRKGARQESQSKEILRALAKAQPSLNLYRQRRRLMHVRMGSPPARTMSQSISRSGC